MTLDTPPGAEFIWTIDDAMNELRRRVDQVLECFMEAFKDEYGRDVLSLDSLRQMELLAEASSLYEEMAVPPRPGSDFGATRRLVDTFVKILQESDDPGPAEAP